MPQVSEQNYLINSIFLQTIKKLESVIEDGTTPISNPMLKIVYPISLDSNLQPIFQGENGEDNLKYFNALQHFNNDSQVILDVKNNEYPLIFKSEKPSFIATIQDYLKTKKDGRFNLQEVIGFFPHSVKFELSTFDLKDPNIRKNVEGKYIFNVSPLFIDKQNLRGFHNIIVGLEFGDFDSTQIHPSFKKSIFQSAILSLENTILKNKPENKLINKSMPEGIHFYELAIDSKNQGMIESFFNNTNQSKYIKKAVFIPAESQEKISFCGLDEIELNVVEYVVQGYSNPRIAELLYNSRNKSQQIKNILNKIYSKLNIDGESKGKRQELIKIYNDNGNQNKHD